MSDKYVVVRVGTMFTAGVRELNAYQVYVDRGGYYELAQIDDNEPARRGKALARCAEAIRREAKP